MQKKTIIIVYFDNNRPNYFSKIFKRLNYDVVFIHFTDNSLKDKIININPIGIVLSGSAQHRINETYIDKFDCDVFQLGIPIIGICFGYQLIVQHFFGKEYIRNNKNKLKEIGELSLEKPFKLPVLVYKINHFDDVINIKKGNKYTEWKTIKFSDITNNMHRSKNETLGIYSDSLKIMGTILHPEKRIKTGIIFFRKWLEYFTEKIDLKVHNKEYII